MTCPNITIGKGLGWKPELPDKRDFLYSARRVDFLDPAAELPVRVRSTKFQRAARTDQRMTSACVGHSTSRHWQQERSLTPRSPLDPYWRARHYRNWENQDEGAYIRDAFKMLSAQGCTRDYLYPDIDANVFRAPSARADDDADNRVPIEYHRIDSDDSGDREQVRRRVLACIASKHSLVGGVTCYDSFFSERTISTGITLLPNLSAEREQGGHAMHFGEYDLDFPSCEYAYVARNMGFPEAELPKEVVIASQSWGPDYGLRDEHFSQIWIFDLNYIIDRMLCDDCWTSRSK
jgi:hypothetical protein